MNNDTALKVNKVVKEVKWIRCKYCSEFFDGIIDLQLHYYQRHLRYKSEKKTTNNTTTTENQDQQENNLEQLQNQNNQKTENQEENTNKIKFGLKDCSVTLSRLIIPIPTTTMEQQEEEIQDFSSSEEFVDQEVEQDEEQLVSQVVSKKPKIAIVDGSGILDESFYDDYEDLIIEEIVDGEEMNDDDDEEEEEEIEEDAEEEEISDFNVDNDNEGEEEFVVQEEVEENEVGEQEIEFVEEEEMDGGGDSDPDEYFLQEEEEEMNVVPLEDEEVEEESYQEEEAPPPASPVFNTIPIPKIPSSSSNTEEVNHDSRSDSSSRSDLSNMTISDLLDDTTFAQNRFFRQRRKELSLSRPRVIRRQGARSTTPTRFPSPTNISASSSPEPNQVPVPSSASPLPLDPGSSLQVQAALQQQQQQLLTTYQLINNNSNTRGGGEGNQQQVQLVPILFIAQIPMTSPNNINADNGNGQLQRQCIDPVALKQLLLLSQVQTNNDIMVVGSQGAAPSALNAPPNNDDADDEVVILSPPPPPTISALKSKVPSIISSNNNNKSQLIKAAALKKKKKSSSFSPTKSKRRYECEICGLSYSRPLALHKHKIRQHYKTNIKIPTPKPPPQQASSVQRVQPPSNLVSICTHCHQGFTAVSQIQQHTCKLIKSTGPAARPSCRRPTYTCKYCSSSFGSIGSKMRHISLLHPNEAAADQVRRRHYRNIKPKKPRSAHAQVINNVTNVPNGHGPAAGRDRAGRGPTIPVSVVIQDVAATAQKQQIQLALKEAATEAEKDKNTSSALRRRSRNSNLAPAAQNPKPKPLNTDLFSQHLNDLLDAPCKKIPSPSLTFGSNSNLLHISRRLPFNFNINKKKKSFQESCGNSSNNSSSSSPSSGSTAGDGGGGIHQTLFNNIDNNGVMQEDEEIDIKYEFY